MFSAAWAVNRYVGSMGWGGLMKVASRWFPVSYHATAMGWLSLSYLLGDALVRLYLGTFIRYGVGWRGIFFIWAAIKGHPCGRRSFCSNPARSRSALMKPPADPANLFGSSGESPHPESLGQLLWPLLGSLSFWLICVMSVGLTLIRETVTLWLPKILKDELQFKEGEAVQWSMLFPLAGAAAAPVGRLSLGSSQRPAFPGRHAGAGVACGQPDFARGAAVGRRSHADADPDRRRGLLLDRAFIRFRRRDRLNLGGKLGSSTAAGLIDAAGYLGAVFSGYGIGGLAQVFGWPTVFLVLAGAAVLTALVTVLYWLRQPQRTETLNLEVPVSEIRLVVFDLAGTSIDFGWIAPVAAFVGAFARHKVTITKANARAPMGLSKKDHVRAIFALPKVAEDWQRVHRRAGTRRRRGGLSRFHAVANGSGGSALQGGAGLARLPGGIPRQGNPRGNDDRLLPGGGDNGFTA